MEFVLDGVMRPWKESAIVITSYQEYTASI